MRDRFDLIIIGGGTAAFACAIKSSENDAKIAMIEGGTIGGTCVNVGCVPTKNLLSVGEKLQTCRNNEGVDFGKIIQDKDNIVLDQRNRKYIDVLKSMHNVKYIEGYAKFRSNNEVEVNGKIISGKNILIATGSSPTIPPIEGISDVDFLTNTEALSLDKKPESMIVIGGRTLGLEFAQMFSRFGTKVTVLQRSQRIIPQEEPEISQTLQQYLEDEGITIYTGVKINGVKKQYGQTVVSFLHNDIELKVSAEKLLLATGRNPNTDDLGLENTDVKMKNGSIQVDEELRTSVPHIYAAGDVLGEPMLETVAAKEGYCSIERLI